MSKIQIDAESRIAYLKVLEEIVTEESYTQFGVATVLNQILVANGRDKIRPQMMYNYSRNGLLVAGQKIFGASLRKITSEEVMEFLIRYCTRNGIEIKVGSVTNPDQMVIDIDELMVDKS
jgi:hypothetical protein